MFLGQIVWPRFSHTAFIGMLAAVIASVIESLGDYSACATMCQVPSPPSHAVNRGIAVEGLGSMLSGIWGTVTGTASYSSNIVVIGITKASKESIAPSMIRFLFLYTPLPSHNLPLGVNALCEVYFDL